MPMALRWAFRGVPFAGAMSVAAPVGQNRDPGGAEAASRDFRKIKQDKQNVENTAARESHFIVVLCIPMFWKMAN